MPFVVGEWIEAWFQPLEQNDIALNRRGIPFVAAIRFRSIRAAMEAKAMAGSISMDLRERAMEWPDRDASGGSR